MRKLIRLGSEATIKKNQVMDAVDILTHVTSSLDYLEDNSERRVSSLLTILHGEIDRAIETLKVSN